MSDPQPVISFLTQFSYLGIFSSIVVSGYVLPVPEEIVLLTIGYLASTGHFSVLAAIVIAFFATLTSDIFLYSLAKKDSKFTHRMKAKVHKNHMVKEWMKNPNQIGRIVFCMRFFVGLRFLGPIMAGCMNMSLKKFILYDTLALLIYTPFFVLLGFYFSHSFLRMVTRVESLRHLLFFVAMTAIGILLLHLAQKNLWRLGIGEKQMVKEETEETPLA